MLLQPQHRLAIALVVAVDDGQPRLQCLASVLRLAVGGDAEQHLGVGGELVAIDHAGQQHGVLDRKGAIGQALGDSWRLGQGGGLCAGASRQIDRRAPADGGVELGNGVEHTYSSAEAAT